jgi:hypothetical protein
MALGNPVSQSNGTASKFGMTKDQAIAILDKLDNR